MTHERAGEKGDADFGERAVAEGPLAAVQRVHEFSFAGQDADGQSAPHDFAVGRKVRADAEHGLHAAAVNAEARDHFIHHEGGARRLGDLAHFAQEFERPRVRMPALHGFDDDRGEILGMVANPLQRLRGAVFQNDHVLDLGRGNAGCHGLGFRLGAAALYAFDQDLVELAMIVAVEDHDFFAARHGACETHRRHDSFRTGVAVGHPLVAGEFAEERGHLAGHVGLRPDREASIQLCPERVDHEGRRMAEGGLAEAVHEVDIFIAVDVMDLRSRRRGVDDGVDHLLPLGTKAGGGARIGENGPMLLREGLGAPRFLGISLDQGIDVAPLLRADAVVGVAPLGHEHGETRRLSGPCCQICRRCIASRRGGPSITRHRCAGRRPGSRRGRRCDGDRPGSDGPHSRVRRRDRRGGRAAKTLQNLELAIDELRHRLQLVAEQHFDAGPGRP